MDRQIQTDRLIDKQPFGHNTPTLQTDRTDRQTTVW